MEREEEEKKHFAVLIDADNISEKYASSIFNEIADYGYASYRRIYGNWAKGNGWKEDTLLENSINPIQQFNYTIGKNATDMAMVIDAMDILYSGKVDGFCLVTSDSDFTKLAMRLREEQKYVIGMGESKTFMPEPMLSGWIKSCRRWLSRNSPEKESPVPGCRVQKRYQYKKAPPVPLCGNGRGFLDSGHGVNGRYPRNSHDSGSRTIFRACLRGNGAEASF